MHRATILVSSTDSFPWHNLSQAQNLNVSTSPQSLPSSNVLYFDRTETRNVIYYGETRSLLYY